MIILLKSYHTRVPLDIYTISFGQRVTFLMIHKMISGGCHLVFVRKSRAVDSDTFFK
jgi:hypothetical protein